MNNKDKEFVAIGFKNSAGGYELRNDFFKVSSSPKYVTYINYSNPEINTKTALENFNIVSQNVLQKQDGISDKNIDFRNEDKVQNLSGKQVKSIAVFEGFF